jgi:SAM-dependent methyltransferase
LGAALGGQPLHLVRRGATFERRIAGDSALALLLRLFAAERPVASAAARERLGVSSLEALVACGMLYDDGEWLRPRVALEPFGELLIASDLRERHHSGAADYVLGPGPATRRLAELAVACDGGRLLDLGCGSGALGLLAAAGGAVVTGVDVSERAIAFARFNAVLNGLAGVELLVGDLFAPVAGRRFERILCNPPYVISPERTFAYRDGPPDLCARIAREAGDHLAPLGVAQMHCNWPERRGRDWRADLAGWFEGTGCDALILEEERAGAFDYASLWLSQEHESADEVERGLEQWLDFYEREGVESIGAGLVVMRRVEGRQPWIEVREGPFRRGPAGASISGLLEARDRLARVSDDASLPEQRLRAAPELELRERRRPGEGGWRTESCELRLGRGYAFAARVDPVAAAIVGQLDGERTLREAAGAVAERFGLEPDALLPGLPGLARQLLGLGLLR